MKQTAFGRQVAEGGASWHPTISAPAEPRFSCLRRSTRPPLLFDKSTTVWQEEGCIMYELFFVNFWVI